tara:strand:- start:106 stop:1374 length:1269 start_codon:yes stop_codon:yes gene_type:complete
MSSGASSRFSTMESDTDAYSRSESAEFEKLCLKIHRKIGCPTTDTVAVAHHGSATRSMLKARDLLVKGGLKVSQLSRTSLLCTGVACMRRVNSNVETTENGELFKTTTLLIFTLLVLGECGDAAEDEKYENITEQTERDDEQIIYAWKESTLASYAFPESHVCNSAWSSTLYSDSVVSRAALREAKYCSGTNAMFNMQTLSEIFFRCSGAAIMQSVLTKAETGPHGILGDTSFLTLDSVAMCNEANDMQSEKLASLVSAAESEAGQAVLRDIILSFKLPLSVVGSRRTLLLPREANHIATKTYTNTLNAAHDAAMRGAEWSWKTDTDPIHKVSAVLAGLAVIISKTPDSVRKGDAFGRLVNLPFIETLPPPNGVVRLALIPATRAWVVYKIDSDGSPKVQASKAGFDGFCENVLLFAKYANV